MLVAILLIGSFPVLAAGPSRSPVGLNGASGKWTDFDKSVYTLVTDLEHFLSADFVWPSSGKILVCEPTGGTFYLITRYENITIPAGLVVDFYRYNEKHNAYAMMGHFDTTDGKPYTITEYTTNVGSTGKADKELFTAVRTFTPGTPSESYSHSFTDVDPSAWYYDAVMTMAEGKMFNGYGDGRFGPEDTLTRAQTQIVNFRLLGNDYEGYTDTATASRAFAAIVLADSLMYGAWIHPNPYENSLLLREYDYVPGIYLEVRTFDQSKGDYVYGIVPGYDPLLANTLMNRSLHDNWVASVNNKNVTYRYSLNEFPDGAAIRQWIRENVSLMREVLHYQTSTDDSVARSCEILILSAWNLGMFSGVDSKGTFDPYAPLTRAQLCQVLYNMGWTYFGCLDYNSITLVEDFRFA